ncbi:MAG: glycosyltransferase family 4 protein [Clostridia bacterium]|nr:glycosyltransferase family 4 protein [Clostridia bacterium]
MFTNKKIMMIATTDNMIWQFMLPHIKYLQEQGNEIQCVCARTGFWTDELKEKHNLVVHEIDFGRNPLKIKNIKGYKQLKKLQEKEKFDLVYCQQPVGGLMGRLVGKKFKIPVIYTAHGFHFFKGCPLVNKVIYKPVEKWLSKYTDILITINEEDYQNALKMKAKKVFKINGIGIDKSKIKIEEFDKVAFRKELGLEPTDKVILTVSEINQNKNYITMLQTIKILVEKDKNIKFVSCGTGVWREKISNYAKELGIENNVIFLGYRKDIGKIMQVSDLFFHASYREGLTLSVMEAMSFGLPCVVSNVRGNRDLIVDGKGGYVAEPTDAQKFAVKIEYLLNNPEDYKVFGEFNKQESEKYSIDNVIAQLAKIYEEV